MSENVKEMQYTDPNDKLPPTSVLKQLMDARTFDTESKWIDDRVNDLKPDSKPSKEIAGVPTTIQTIGTYVLDTTQVEAFVATAEKMKEIGKFTHDFQEARGTNNHIKKCKTDTDELEAKIKLEWKEFGEKIPLFVKLRDEWAVKLGKAPKPAAAGKGPATPKPSAWVKPPTIPAAAGAGPHPAPAAAGAGPHPATPHYAAVNFALLRVGTDTIPKEFYQLDQRIDHNEAQMDALRLTILADSARKGITVTLAQILVDQEATRQECMASDKTLSLTVAALQDQANATKDAAIIALGHDIKRQLTVGIHKRLTRAESNIKYVELLQKHIDAGQTASSHFEIPADNSHPVLITNAEMAIGTVAHSWELEITQLKTELASANDHGFLLPLVSETEAQYAQRIGAIVAAGTIPPVRVADKYFNALYAYLGAAPPSPTGSAKSKGSKAGSKHDKTTTDGDDSEEEEEESDHDQDDHILLLEAHIEKLTDWGLKIQQAARDMYPTYAREKQFFGDTWKIAGGPVTKLPAVLKTKLVRTPTTAEGCKLVDEDDTARERAIPSWSSRSSEDDRTYSAEVVGWGPPRSNDDIERTLFEQGLRPPRGGTGERNMHYDPRTDPDKRNEWIQHGEKGLLDVDDTHELRPRGRNTFYDDLQMEESRGSAEYTRPSGGASRSQFIAGPIDWDKAISTYQFDPTDDERTRNITTEMLRDLATTYNETNEVSEHKRFVHTAHALKEMSATISGLMHSLMRYQQGEATEIRKQVFKNELAQIMLKPTDDNDEKVHRTLAGIHNSLIQSIDTQGSEDCIPLVETFLQLAKNMREVFVRYMQSPVSQTKVSFKDTEFDSTGRSKYNKPTLEYLETIKSNIKKQLKLDKTQHASLRYQDMVWNLIKLLGTVSVDNAAAHLKLRQLTSGAARDENGTEA